MLTEARDSSISPTTGRRAYADVRRRDRCPSNDMASASTPSGSHRRAQSRIKANPRRPQAPRIKTQLWVLLDLGAEKRARSKRDGSTRRSPSYKPLAEEADKIGCTLAFYNHGGWFGEPENQIAIIERLERRGSRTSGSSTTSITATNISTASRRLLQI